MKEKRKNDRKGRWAELIKRLRLLVPEERGVWLVCMAISLVFWMLVKMSKTYITSKPVGYDLYVPSEKALAQLPPANLVVELESTGWNLLRENFLQDSVTINVNLRQTDRLVLDGSQLRAAVKDRLVTREIGVLDLNYNRLIFDLEARGRRRIPVRIKPRLSFHPEYQLLDSVVVEPDSVWVSGPISQLPLQTEAITDTFSLQDLQSDRSLRLPLDAPLPTLSLEPRTVSVEVRVEQFTEWEEFIPLRVQRSNSDSLNLFPKKVLLSCTVGLSRYDDLSADEFTVEIDLRNVQISPNRNTVPIQIVRQPDYVKNVSISPKAAEFYLVEVEEEGE